MRFDPVFLNVGDVERIHLNTIRLEGGLEGLRDSGMLASAVAMPRQRFKGEYLHRDLAAMASAYLYHLAMNHAFLDGNKRVASLSSLIFLRANGVEVGRLPSASDMIDATLKVAASQMPKPDLIEWYRKQLGRSI